MAAKKPLVLTAGQVEQLQSGDTLDATVTGKEIVAVTNKNAGTINIGQAVYQKTTTDQVDLAQANASGTSRACGLVADATIAADASGNVQTNGVFTATTEQWDAVAGTTGGLVAGSIYYLSAATAGSITATAPTSGWVQELGLALAATELLLEPRQSIKL